MNVTTLVLNRDFKSAGMDNIQLRKDAGLLDYKRNIIISIKEKHLNDGIHVNDTIVSKIGCTIINYSISNIGNDRRLYSKTTYLCDIDFDPRFDKNILSKENIEKFGISKISQYFNQAHIIPMYAYSNDNISNPDGSYIDFGLTLVELDNNAASSSGYNIINFSSKETQSSQIYKEYIEGNYYNPKYYILKESKMYGNIPRNGVLNDYVDEKTSISWYPYTKMTSEYYIHNELQPGIHFNKKVAKSMNLLNDLFNELIFVPKEYLQFTYDNTYPNPFNINRMSYFTIFNKQYREDRTTDIIETIKNIIGRYENEEFKTRFRIEFTQREYATNLIVHFYDNDSTVVVQSPNDSLFNEYAMSKELELETKDNEKFEIEKAMFIDDYYHRTMHMIANVSEKAAMIADTISYQNKLIEATAQFIKDGSRDPKYLVNTVNKEATKVLQKIENRENFLNNNMIGK